MMETIMRGIQNVLVYIDDLLLHSKDHEHHLQVLEEVLQRLAQNNIKINIEKCIFGNPNVSYLGYRLTPEGIKPGQDKLEAVRKALPPTDTTMVKSFYGLCNFFRSHIKDFATIASPLTKITRKDSTYKGGPLPPDALEAFNKLKSALSSEPVVAYPRSDRAYALIADASTGTDKLEGGLGAILTQVDDKGTFYVIAYGSRQLKEFEKNYPPYTLEMAAASWGMKHFENYLKGKHFTLYTDHKPLISATTRQTKSLNHIQQLMTDFDFELKYKEGASMPADFLSRLPANISSIMTNFVFDVKHKADSMLPVEFQSQAPAPDASVTAISPFMTDISAKQMEIPELQQIAYRNKKGSFSPTSPIETTRSAQIYADRTFCDRNNIWWIRLDDSNYPRTALWLPEEFRQEALCSAHGAVWSGHDGPHKTYLRLSASYFWPRMRADIDNHVQTCLKCQKHKKKSEKSPLQPLPIPDQPNQRVHMDLFGPLMGSDQGKKFVLTMTDAFTKFAKATVIDNKSAQTVAQAIFDTWISFIGVPHQIHTDQGKEFVNEVCKTLCTELLITHTKTAAYHPQANAQAEVFNKHIQKYLARFVSEHTLDWEQYIPTMLFSYNTSVHSSTNSSPFEALFGFRPNMPSLIQQDIQRLHYQDDVTINRIKVLKSLQSDMRETLINKQAEYKERFDRKAFDHNINIGDEVMEKIHQFSNKNTKLAEKWNGPYKIINIDAKNANIEVKGKTKTVTVDNLKKFFRPAPQEAKPVDDNRRVTRSRAKLINLPNKPTIQAVAKLINLRPSIKDSRYKLKDIAYKLYHLKLAFNQLTSTEQKLWTSFKLSDILQLLSGHPNREPIFKSNDVYFGAPTRRPQALPNHDIPP
jgi:transposase InsO family protein